MGPQRSLIILVALVSLCVGVQVPLIRRAASHQPGKLSTRSVDVSNNKHAAALRNVEDFFYCMNITLGSQEMLVAVDTGSTDLWVYDPEGRVKTVNTTSVLSNTTYASGSISGPIEFAAMEFAGFSIPSQAFVHANETIAMEALSSNGASGLLGLGFDNSSSMINLQLYKAFGSVGLGRSPIGNIFHQNMSLPDFFTVLLGRGDDLDGEQAGIITISEYIDDYRSIANAPRLTTRAQNRWSVLVDDISVANESLPINSSVFSTPVGKAVAMLDSGYSLPPIPRQFVDAIYTKFPGAILLDDTPSMGPWAGHWIVPCDQVVELSFTIGGVKFPIHPLDMTKVQSATLDERNVTFCVNTFENFDLGEGFAGLDMILGGAFLRNAYVSHDYGSFNSSGQRAELPFMQLLPLTEVSAARREFESIRATALVGVYAPSPAELKSLLLAELASSESDSPTSEDEEHHNTSGVLANVNTNLTGDSDLAKLLNKYGPAIIGLLAANVFALLILCALGLYFCVTRRGSPSARSLSTSYHPVRMGGAKEKGNLDMEPVFASRYDA